ncbi:MAG TPA: histidine kinase [Steroidobacteraceae bacterium]|nr:histidine kinase [Steroidobacteraceae bacterium]
MNRGFGAVSPEPDHAVGYNRPVLKRDRLGVPGFWPLQIIGWSGYYLLVFASILPSLSRIGDMLREFSLCTIMTFVGSCVLRPICRRLIGRGFAWTALEIRGALWALLIGTVAAVSGELWTHPKAGFNWPDTVEQSAQAAILLFLWCSLYFSIKLWQQSASERERLLRAEAEIREARLSALRYQLNPHFLFNSLNAVSTLVLDGHAAAATRMLAQIAELLRTILDSESATETRLSQEIALTEQYLAIEQIRLGDRLRLEIATDPDTLDALVPSLLLQPLVENAVRHGIAPQVQRGTIRICSQRQQTQLCISVRNSGAIVDADTANPLTTGIGLSNTAARLQTLYGENQHLDLQWLKSGGCEVTVRLPFREAPRPIETVACAS